MLTVSEIKIETETSADSSTKLTDCIQSGTDQEMRIIKLEEDLITPDTNYCMHWQVECSDQIMNPLSNKIHSQMQMVKLEDNLIIPDTNNCTYWHVKCSSEIVDPLSCYSQDAADNGTLTQQEENTQTDNNPEVLYQSQDHSVIISPTTNKLLKVVESSSTQSSLRGDEKGTENFSVKETASSTMEMSMHSSGNLDVTEQTQSKCKCGESIGKTQHA